MGRAGDCIPSEGRCEPDARNTPGPGEAPGRRLSLREAVRPPRRGGVADDERPDTEEEPIPGIRCPRCSWQPRPSDRWVCSCGMVWNTFMTHGVCPRCRRQWEVTACLDCHGWSRHLDWYCAPRGPLL